MTRRALLSIIGVVVVALLLFGVPLAIAIRSLTITDELNELEREAARAAIAVSPDGLGGRDPVELPPVEHAISVGVYDAAGTRVSGRGPNRLEAVVARVFDGEITSHRGRSLVVAVPVVAGERVIGAVRASSSTSDVSRRVRAAWFLVAGLAVVVTGLSAVLAFWQARRISRPLQQLATNATQLGGGDFTVRNDASGVSEVDAVARALDTTAEKLGDSLSRERAFSADVSHQLRTPLTALRLALERNELADALDECDRLDATIEELLRLARDTHDDHESIDIVPVIDAAIQVWHGRLAADGRPLRVESHDARVVALVSRDALAHVLDVLLANASTHGAGTVTIRIRRLGEGVAIDVADEGAGVADESRERIFERRSSGVAGREGIGLALARNLVEAEGGRLVLSSARPPVFTVVLPAH
jgi:signal transduction histidine kinase